MTNKAQQFIQIVEDKIKSLERDKEYTKQGVEYYEKLDEKIELLTDLLNEFKQY